MQEKCFEVTSIACIYVNHDSVNLIGDSKQRYPLCVGSNFKWALCIIFPKCLTVEVHFWQLHLGASQNVFYRVLYGIIAVVIHIH